MSFGEGFVFGILVSVFVAIISQQHRDSPDTIYRNAYQDALDHIASRLIDAARNGSKRRAQGIYEDFIFWEYYEHSMSCKYDLPWENKK